MCLLARKPSRANILLTLNRGIFTGQTGRPPLTCDLHLTGREKKIRKSRKNNTKTKEIILKLTAVWQKLDTQFVPKFERLKRTVIGNSGHLAGKRYAVWIRMERIMAVGMTTGLHVSFTSSDKSCIP